MGRLKQLSVFVFLNLLVLGGFYAGLPTNFVEQQSGTVSAAHTNPATDAECKAIDVRMFREFPNGIPTETPICACPNSLVATHNGCFSREQLTCESDGGVWVIEETQTGAGLNMYCDCPANFFEQPDGSCQSLCEVSGGQLNGSKCVCPAEKPNIASGSGASTRCTAQGGVSVVSGQCEVNGSIFGIPTWYRGLEFDEDCSAIIDQDKLTSIDSTNPATIIVANITDMILRIAGIIAVVFVIVGGFKYVLSDGSPDKAAEARKTIINALIGAVIAGSASIIVGLIVRTLGA